MKLHFFLFVSLLLLPRQYQAQIVAFDAQTIILGNGVNVREKPEPAAKVVGKLDFWEPVTVSQKTESYSELVEGSWHSGEGYPWFLVKAANGVSGWVFGQYVGTEPEGIGNGESEYRVGETYFSLYTTASRWYSPIEAGEGPYYEETTTYFFFQQSGMSAIYPVMSADGKEPLSKNGGSGWGGCDLSEVWYPDHSEGHDLMLHFDCGYQEGGEKFFYYLSLQGQRMVVTKEWTTGAIYPAGN